VKVRIAETVPSGAKQAAEKPRFRVCRGLIPGINAIKSMGPLGPDVDFQAIPHKFRDLSAACKVRPLFSASYGTTTKVEPFQNPTFATGC